MLKFKGSRFDHFENLMHGRADPPVIVIKIGDAGSIKSPIKGEGKERNSDKLKNGALFGVGDSSEIDHNQRKGFRLRLLLPAIKHVLDKADLIAAEEQEEHRLHRVVSK